MPGLTKKKPRKKPSTGLRIVHRKPGPKHKGAFYDVTPETYRRSLRGGKNPRGAKRKTGARGIGNKKK